MNFFGGRIVKIYFEVTYLHVNKLIGYVDFSDFDEIWPENLSYIDAPKCVRLKLTFGIFFLGPPAA